MESLLELVRESHGTWTLVAVYLAAALEYLIPPLPADSVVLAASLLVISGAHPFSLVALVAVAGGATGALGHYGLGRLLAMPDGRVKGEAWVERFLGEQAIERFLVAFRRWGMWVIAVNRGFPGVRAVTFFAAGAANLPLGKTMLAGLVSNVAWTLFILGLGVSIGESYEKIQAAFYVYKTVIYALGALAIAVLVGIWWWRRRQ